jgi:uracil-DNA glycosylase
MDCGARYNRRFSIAFSIMSTASSPAVFSTGSAPIPASIRDALRVAHVSWHPVLLEGLEALAKADPAYLPALAKDHYLPTQGRLFAAFTLPLDEVRYVLVGEGPYPREESATGVCFMDGAVEALWSEKGLSRQVNRATSLRNFMKMLLVAEGVLTEDATSGEVMAEVSSKARAIGSPYIQTLTELQAALTRQGFLLLNASLVFREQVAPVKDARAWQPFLDVVLGALAEAGPAGSLPPTLVLWGKIAEQLKGRKPTARFPQAISEHPYNLSFIANKTMQQLFGPMRLLFKPQVKG